MGASKTHQFTSAEIKSATIAKALAHPARIRIITILKEHSTLRNVDLMHSLSLSKTSVHAHLICLMKADQIEQVFNQNADIL
jgi:predicted transcriptional regulator